MTGCLCHSPVIDFLTSTGFRIGAAVLVVVAVGVIAYVKFWERGYF